MLDLLFEHRNALIIIIGFLIGILLYSGLKDWCRRQWNILCLAASMKGPPALPIIGNAHYFTGHPNKILNTLRNMAESYETLFRVWFGMKLIVVVNNPSEIEVLMKSPHASYKSSEYRFTEAFMGPGLITSSGPRHKIHRNLIMPIVNGKVLDEFMDSIDIQSQRCVKCLENKVDIGEFDIMSHIDYWSADIVLDTIIGTSDMYHQEGNPELTERISKLSNLSYERTIKIWLHQDWIYSCTKAGREHNAAVAHLQKLMDGIVAQKKKKYYNSKNSNSLNMQQSALLDKLIAYNEEHKLMDDIQLRDEVFTVFVAGQDPPALISAFILMMLAMHPEIQDKVREEVQRVIGDEKITPSNLSQLKYLTMVVKETIRLFPIGPILMRELTDDVILDSYTIPKGCTVAMFLFMMYRDPRLWNEPNKFDPDRFLPENSVGRHPYAFIPFSSGIRGCIGKQFGIMMMKTLVIRIVQKYRLKRNGSLEKLQLACNIVVRSVDGYKLSITRI